MLRQRVITAVILLAAFLGALQISAQAFLALVACALGAAAFEWFRLAGFRDRSPLIAGIAFGAALLLLDWHEIRPGPVATFLIAGSALALWVIVGVWLLSGQRQLPARSRWPLALLGVAVLSATWVSVGALLDAGAAVLISTAAVVWVADIAAYFTGRALGRRKLAPQISPGKTWEGVWGALVAVTVIALLAWALDRGSLWFSTRLLSAFSLAVALAALLSLVALSIVGDLFESWLKRQAGVKDSSGLLPGHGGVLDRIDALLPVLPAATFLAHFLIVG